MFAVLCGKFKTSVKLPQQTDVGFARIYWIVNFCVEILIFIK